MECNIYNKWVYVIISDINSIRTENSQKLAVEKYSFLDACSKEVYLSGFHMSREYSIGTRERVDKRKRQKKRREEREQGAVWGIH